MSAQPKDIPEIHDPMPFKETIEGNVYLIIEGDTARVILLFETSPDNPISFEPQVEFKLNLSLFTDRQQIYDWISSVHTLFQARLRDFLAREAIRFHEDIVNFKLNKMGTEPPINMRDVIKSHSEKTANDLRERFYLQGPGTYSEWTRFDLVVAIRNALDEIPGRARNYQSVSEWLKKHYGDKAPASGESLRQLMRRLGIDWKGLKAERKA